MTELDFLMTLDSGGVVEKEDGAAYVEVVREWLSTPISTVWGDPSWGNNLNQYKHQPQSTTTESAIENSILLKLPTDCPSIKIGAILCESIEKDLYQISIFTRYGVISERVSL